MKANQQWIANQQRIANPSFLPFDTPRENLYPFACYLNPNLDLPLFAVLARGEASPRMVFVRGFLSQRRAEGFRDKCYGVLGTLGVGVYLNPAGYTETAFEYKALPGFSELAEGTPGLRFAGWEPRAYPGGPEWGTPLQRQWDTTLNRMCPNGSWDKEGWRRREEAVSDSGLPIANSLKPEEVEERVMGLLRGARLL